MIDIPQEIKDLYWSDNTKKANQKKLKFIFYKNGEQYLVIENNKIVSETFKLTESLSSEEDLKFGSCESSKLEVTVADIQLNLTGLAFDVIITIGTYDFSLGQYIVESFTRQADRRKRSIVAYNEMIKFNRDVSDWYNGLTFPISLKNFRDSLCNYIGIEQETQSLVQDDIQIEKTIQPSELLGIDVLEAICEINGCFGQVRKNRKLKYVSIGTKGLYPSETLYPKDDLYPLDSEEDTPEKVRFYKKIVYEDYSVQGIDKVQIRQEEGDIGAIYGNGTNAYIIEGNFLVYGKSAEELSEIAQNAYNIIQGITYIPSQVECVGLPWIEVGDKLTAQTNDDFIETIIMTRTLSGTQALSDTFVSTGNQNRQEVRDINTEIIQLKGQTTIIKKSVEGISVTVSDLEKETESKFELTDEKFTTAISNLSANMESRFEVTDEAISSKVSKGTISSEISQEAGLITIRSNRFVLSSTNCSISQQGVITATGVNISGRITAESGKIGPWSITSSSIYKGNSAWGSSLGMYFGDSGLSLGDKFKVSSDGTVTASAMNITGGSIKIETSTSNYSIISLKGAGKTTDLAPGYINMEHSGQSAQFTDNSIILLNSFSADLTGIHLYKKTIATGGFEASGQTTLKDLSVSGQTTLKDLLVSGDIGLGSSPSIVATGTLTISSSYITFSARSTFSMPSTFNDDVTFSAACTATFSGTTNVNSTFNVKPGLYNVITASGTSIRIGASTGYVGFFGSSGATKKTVANIYSPSSATASTIATKLNDLLTALRGYGLIR